jgi:hypothetical protein
VNKPLVYIDQNVLGLQIDGVLDLARINEVQWVYSKEHFAEIRRSDNPQKYLEVLRNINAKLLELELENSKITGTAKLSEAGSPEEKYSEYVEAISQVEFNDRLFDALLAWVNGGGDERSLRAIPELFLSQIQALNEQLPASLRVQHNEVPNSGFIKMLEQMVSTGNDINKTREMFGGGNGRFGSVSGESQLLQIWEIIKPACNGITSDRFFGFDPAIKQGYDSFPLFLGIVGCCAVLDIIGFQAEKKGRKLEKIQNVRSDATHIGMGAFCSAILSADRRLAKRAKAIYEYKKIGTVALIVEVAS